MKTFSTDLLRTFITSYTNKTLSDPYYPANLRWDETIIYEHNVKNSVIKIITSGGVGLFLIFEPFVKFFFPFI